MKNLGMEIYYFPVLFKAVLALTLCVMFKLCPLFTVDSVFLQKPKPPGKISEEKVHIILHFYTNPVFR